MLLMNALAETLLAWQRMGKLYTRMELEVCARHGLKTRCDLDADAVFAEALHDKKRAGDTIDLVIPHGIGRCSIDRTPLSAFHELIAEGLGQKGDASAC